MKVASVLLTACTHDAATHDLEDMLYDARFGFMHRCLG
jgi:hypothetical protein